MDILDISIVVKAVGSYLGYPRWDETADVDKDDFIKIMSLSSVVDSGKTSARPFNGTRSTNYNSLHRKSSYLSHK